MFSRIILGLFLGVTLWAVVHFEFGILFDRAHSRGCRIYRIDSYEQFMQEKAGTGASLLA